MKNKKKEKPEIKKVSRRRKRHNPDARYLSRLTKVDREFIKDLRNPARFGVKYEN